MKIVVTILALILVVMLAWNIFPLIVGIIKLVFAGIFISTFVIGFLIGRWSRK